MTDRADEILASLGLFPGDTSHERDREILAAALREKFCAQPHDQHIEFEYMDQIAGLLEMPSSDWDAILVALRNRINFAQETRQAKINHARLERAENLLGKFAHFRFGHDANCSSDEQKRKAYQEAADFLGLDEIRAPLCANAAPEPPSEPPQQTFTKKDLIWSAHECPRCHEMVPIGCMSLSCTCNKCGAFFADAEERGWYRSAEAYRDGEERIE